MPTTSPKSEANARHASADAGLTGNGPDIRAA